MELLDSIDASTIVGKRDRALIATMLYSFARIGAVVAMNVDDYEPRGRRMWINLREKGGRRHSVPAHHSHEVYLDDYVLSAGISREAGTPLLRTFNRKKQLSNRRIHRREALAMIKRRARDADLSTTIGCHTMRATGITAYLSNGGLLKHAQKIAAHASSQTTRLYARRSDLVSLDEIERIVFRSSGNSKTEIFQRERTWYCNFQQSGQQIRRSLATTSKKEAILRAQRLETELSQGGIRGQISIASLAEVIEAFLAHHQAENRASRTLSKYQNVTSEIAQLAASRRVTRIDDLNAQFADAYRQMLKLESNKPRTIYNKLIALRSLMIFAKQRGMCMGDPLEGDTLNKPKATHQPFWTPEKVDQIIASTPSSYQAFPLFLRETGCRAGEGLFCRRLNWG